MTAPVWQTAKSLGIVEENVYFEKQLLATSTGNVSYSIISGDRPNGIQITSTGLLYGIPTRQLKDDRNEEKDYLSYFTVRAENQNDEISDKTFNLFISGVEPPTIISDKTHLGTFYDGEYFNCQLLANDNYSQNLTWKIVRGRIPPGITMSDNGLLEGFLYQNKIDPAAGQRQGWDRIEWDRYMWDYITSQNDHEYEFTLELTDGINYSRQNYSITIVARDLLTADRDSWIPYSRFVTADTTPRHLPFISTMPQTLPEIRIKKARQDTYFAFKFEAIDLDGEKPYFEITSPDEKGFDQDGDIVDHRAGKGFDSEEFDGSEYPMPLFLGLNNDTGWYTGQLNDQFEFEKQYTFQIYARKSYSLSLRGFRNTYHLNVLGEIEENIEWLTESDLGEIDNGSVSALKVEARHNQGYVLKYRLVADPTSRTPQGVILQPDGMLSGRCTFNYFKTDNELTTFDDKNTTFDSFYTFRVRASTLNDTSYVEKTFTLKVNNIYKEPYENLYLRGFPSREDRLFFNSILNNTEIIPNRLIYRSTDPWYGKAREMRFLAVPGVKISSMAEYQTALEKNHYTKTLLFGEIKTAVALDKNFDIAYEVVYLEVIDEGEIKDTVSDIIKYPAQEIDISGNKNTFNNSNDPNFKIFAPNSLSNMNKRIRTELESANVGSLPLWMTSPQPIPDSEGEFTVPLGYVRAVPLVYTVAGGSELIAFRLKQLGVKFNEIEFKFDRYQLDKALSEYYDIEDEKFIPARECTFDQKTSVAEKFRLKGEVDYAVTSPFAKIHGKTVDYIKFWSGIDGQEGFVDGETIIFLQQEKFDNDPYEQFVGFDGLLKKAYLTIDKPRFLIPFQSSSDVLPFDNEQFDYGRVGYKRWLVNDGVKLPYSQWFYWTDGWVVELPFESEGFGQNLYSKTLRVTGYLDQILNRSKNLRAAVYRIKINIANQVMLEVARETEPGDIVTIKQGTHAGKQFYFEAYTNHGNVPRWWPFTDTLQVDPTDIVPSNRIETYNDYLIRDHAETTFDKRGTRFFTNRDQYSGPETNAKYIKFPKVGVFI